MPGPMGGPRGAQSVEKAKDFKGTTKKLIKNYLSKYKIGIIVVLVFAIGSTIFSIVGPKILGNATTEIFNGLVGKISGTGGINFGKVGSILLTLLGLYLISALFSFIQSFTMTEIAQKITYKMRNDLSAKINKLPMNYFDKKTNGEVLSVITNDIDTLSMNLNQSVTQVITSICTLMGILIMMLSISWQMTLISIIVMPIGAFLVKIIVGKSQKYFKMQQDYLGHVNGQVEEVFSGLTVVKAFNGEDDASQTFEKANAELVAEQKKAEGISAVGKAEADAIKAKLLAEAEGLDRKAEAMSKMQQAAVIEMIVDKLPEIVKNAASPLSNVDSITMYGEGNSDKLVEDVMMTTGKIMEGIQGSTGLDVKALLSGALGGKIFNGNNADAEEIANKVIDAISESNEF